MQQSSTKPLLHCKEKSPLTEQENAQSNRQNRTSAEFSKPTIIPPLSLDGVKTTSNKSNSNKPPNGGPAENSHNDNRTVTIVTSEIEDDWTGFDEGLMKDIVRELDDWDNDYDLACEQLLGANRPSTTHKEHHDNSHGVTRPSTRSGTINTQPVLQPLQENARLMAGTPSRPDFVSHVAPVTLLSCPRHGSGEKSLQSPMACGPSSKVQSICSNACSEICVVDETPPYSAENATNHRTKLLYSGNTTQHTAHPHNQTASNFNHICTSSTPTGFTPRLSPNLLKNTHPTNALQQNRETPNSALNFRTPSTSEWMKVKRLSSGSTHTPSPSSTHTALSDSTYTPSSNISGSISGELLSSGGKVTPPLCNCGRRTVSTPGPNEGQTFYACPNGKASDKSRGCGFFKWERMLACSSSSSSSWSSQSFTSSYSRTNTMSCNKLEPEYFESKR